MLAWIRFSFRLIWRTIAIVLLLSIAATIPVLQFASLGYMLECAARVSNGERWDRCFPGSETAGKLLTLLACAFLSWLPVWFVADQAYAAGIIQAGSATSRGFHFGARFIAVIWIVWVLWAVFRGGKLRHFLWPAPVLAVRSLFRKQTWIAAEDRLWHFIKSLRLPYLLWLGVSASIGALIWLTFPASLMVIGLIGNERSGAGVLGLIGAFAMIWVVSQLPFLQLQLARDQRFWSVLDIRSSRQMFRSAPWSVCLATWITVLFAIPLYLLRIEPPPPQLWWILSIFFVILTFPAKLCVGWALRRTISRQSRSDVRPWVFLLWRYLAWVPQLAIVIVYLGMLYLARFALWEGAASVYLQHAFLPPVPFFIR
jgi:hypothetical protein